MPLDIASGPIGPAELHVVKVLASDLRRGIITDREPHLGATPGVQIVGRSGASHLGCYPAGLQGVGENIGPAARDGECKKYIVQLGIGLGLLPTPWAMFPGEILQTGVAILVET